MFLPDSILKLSTIFSQVEKDDMPLFLEDLFTPSELVELAERITLLQSLQQGKTQRSIAQEQGVSVTTVSRGARVLKYGKGIIQKYL